jgi:replicative DNA helicase
MDGVADLVNMWPEDVLRSGEHSEPTSNLQSEALKYWADHDSPRSDTGVVQGLVQQEVPVRGPISLWTPGNENDGGLKPLSNRDNGPRAVSTTGFNELDRRLGGYRPGYVYGILAPTNVGKSTFIVQAANQLCRDGKRVLLVITEMDVREAVLRFAATDTGLKALDIQSGRGSGGDRNQLVAFEERFKKYPLAIHYTTSPNQAAIEQLIQEQKPDAVLWDYFQHFETGTDSRQQQLGSLARWYESMALKYQIPFIVAAQLHRRINFKTQRYEPSTMDSIKDCKVLNDAAKVVLTLNWSQDEQASEDGPVNVEVNIEKNKGPQARFNLLLNRAIPRFENL